MSQLSTVSKSELACIARARAPATLSRIQRTLVAEKVGVDDQPGLLLDGLSRAVDFQALAKVCGPPVLPDDRVMDWASGLTVPDDRRFRA